MAMLTELRATEHRAFEAFSEALDACEEAYRATNISGTPEWDAYVAATYALDARRAEYTAAKAARQTAAI